MDSQSSNQENTGPRKRIAEKQFRREEIEAEDDEGGEEQNGTWDKANSQTIQQRRRVKVRRGGSTLIPENIDAVPAQPSATIAPILNFGFTASNGNENPKEKSPEKEKTASPATTTPTTTSTSPLAAPTYGGFNFGTSEFKPMGGELTFASVSSAQPNSIFKFDFGSNPNNKLTQSNENGDGEGESSAEVPFEVPVESKPNLPPAEPSKTGEEEENTLFTCKAKLYEFDIETKNYKERGAGYLKLNTSNEGEKSTHSTRVIMRTEGTRRVILNNRIWANTQVSKHGNSTNAVLFFGVNMDTNKPTQYVFRMTERDKAQTDAAELIRLIEEQKKFLSDQKS